MIRFSLLLAALPLMATQGLHLDTLIEMALERSPDINVSQLDFEAAATRVDTATSYYLPSLDAQASGGYGGVKLENRDMSNDTLLGATLSASQLLYDFGKTGGSIDAAQEDANASFSQLKQVISNKIFEVKNAYYELLQQKSLLLVNEKNVDLNKKQLHRAERYFEAGIKTRIDVSDAQVNLISSQITLQNNLYDIKLKRITLEKSIGIRANETLPSVYSATPRLPYLYNTLDDEALSIKEAEAFAFENRYELMAYYDQINAARSRMRSVDADYFPQLYANGAYSANHVDAQPFVPEQQWSATLNVSWNLFSGFRTDAQVQERHIALMRAQALLESAKLRVKEEVDTAYINVFKSRDKVKLSQSLALAAEEKYTQAQKRYEHGLSDYIELQQSLQNYIDSLAALVTSYYDHYRARAALDRAIGR